MGLEVLWLDEFEEDISYGDLRGLYQLKNPTSLSVAYFATWEVHGSLVRVDPLLKKGYRYGWFVAEGEWGRSIPAGNDVVQVRNFFNEDSMYFFHFLSLFYVYIHFSHKFSSYSLFLRTFADITWSKGTCLVHEVGRKVSGIIKKFQSLQSEGDVMSTTRLARAGLIEESLPSSSGGD